MGSVWFHLTSLVGLALLSACASTEAQSPVPHPLTINGVAYPPLDREMMAEHPTKIVPPLYPAAAEDHRIEGFVDLGFTIRPDGTLGNVKVIREVPHGYDFADCAMAVFRYWKFPPTIVAGEAVSRDAVYRMSWRLH